MPDVRRAVYDAIHEALKASGHEHRTHAVYERVAPLLFPSAGPPLTLVRLAAIEGIGDALGDESVWLGPLIARGFLVDRREVRLSVAGRRFLADGVAAMQKSAGSAKRSTTSQPASSPPVEQDGRSAREGLHRLEITIDEGQARTSLICPERGCSPSSTCGRCGRDVDDDESRPCYDCPREASPCWLASWYDDADLTDFMTDQPVGTFAIDAEYDGESPVVTIASPSPPSEGDGHGLADARSVAEAAIDALNETGEAARLLERLLKRESVKVIEPEAGVEFGVQAVYDEPDIDQPDRNVTIVHLDPPPSAPVETEGRG